VIARGCRYSGMTIHMVNEAYDEGQIILQKAVPVPLGCGPEELGAEVLKREHAYYWRVIRAFAVGEITPTTSDEPGLAVNLGTFPERVAHDEEARSV
jgi:phosphoribosylglycinamide formyltransferase 1